MVLDAMLPDDQGKINKLSLHEGTLNLHLMQICILIISFQPWNHGMDSDQLVDFPLD